MVRRGFLKGLGLLLLVPAGVVTHLLRGTLIRRTMKKSSWIYYRSPTGEMTPIVGSGVFFLNYNYPVGREDR